MEPTPTSSLKKRAEGEFVVPNYGSSSSLDSMSSSQTRPRRELGRVASVRRYLAAEVDGSQVNPPLSAYAFMTGYIDAISFSTIFVWVGFQTGNFTQLALSFARTIEAYLWGPPESAVFFVQHPPVATRLMPPAEQLAACSIFSFVLGTFLFGRIGDRIGTHKRGWLVFGTLFQALLTLASAITFRLLEQEPSIPPTIASLNPLTTVSLKYFFGIACLSMSLGVQGIMARRLATAFSTTIVLTAIFVELTANPALFQFSRSSPARDQQWLAAIFLFIGASVARLILGQVGVASTLAVAVLFRVAIAFSWLFIPARHIHLP
ncbi:hypothetical protein CC1G_05222 [Coprinopsis cinerea okayama7|uniref:Uncharacterized protein n=1 Tax=Coprinopsis cinerea (strain Okayama-7 / 130 / ATCC MYA-4618 / FGSC 9003) TaxID=240176 RepID=A8PC81_COPC7|nr:hypothetical protein CC1G_05222 [Coprinopsis cinerea okayama7\|eukprot:XP_001840336.2 hypothetical protein CC1G_05222 [Coprinopsis cinerea okayama7\